MGERAQIVIDTNILLNLATPVVDSRRRAPTGGDPLRTVLTGYDVHVPTCVLGEIQQARSGNDLLAAAAELVMRATQHLTTHDIETGLDEPPDFGLDPGESHGIWLANELSADMFVTDDFSTTNYLFVALALDDRNTLFTTPHLLCKLARQETLDPAYVDAVLTYYAETKGWDRQYVEMLRSKYLSR